MAKYYIYSPSSGDTEIASGYPTYHAAYGKPAYLEFNIYSPTPIPFEVGSDVVYRGRSYKLYSIPEPKKQARSGEAGDAFYYQGVQFHDATRELENFIFTDKVLNGGEYFFSSRESTSTYENLQGILDRLTACVNDFPSPNSWVFKKVDGFDNDPDLAAVANEPKEFPISGQSILDACNQITGIFKGVGWIYNYDDEGDEHQIIFGAPNIRTAGNTTGPFVYGKGGGLISLKKYITNKDKLCTRLYAYGGERNMSPRHYNAQEILSADAVDIPNLMIPISRWGLTYDEDSGRDLPDARKAYVEDAAIVAALGMIPRKVYFDNDENGDIFPTIKGLTVQAIWEYDDEGGEVDYLPDYQHWSGDQRIDEVLSVQPSIADSSITTFDNGLAGDNGKSAFFKSTNSTGGTASKVLSNPVADSTGSISLNVSKTFTLPSTITDAEIYPVIRNAVLNVTQSGGLTFTSGYAFIIIQYRENGSLRLVTRATREDNVLVVSNDSLSMSLTKEAISFFADGVINASTIDAGEITMALAVTLNYSVVTGSNPITINFAVAGDYVLTINAPLLTDFRLHIPPFGYDLTNILSTDGKVRIAMTSGKCAGREFEVTACSFDDYNGIILSLNRQYDESLSQYFPNSIYPIQQDDTFVILGIAMPDLYIESAERRLLAAAQSYYALNSQPRYLYTPEVDSAFLADNRASMPMAGMFMELNDAEITGGNTEYILIDSVTIAEGESSIPVVSVTLRERLNVPSAT